MWRWVRGQRERAAQGREEQRKTPVKHLRVHLYTYYMLLHIVHVYDITRRGGGRSVGGLKRWQTAGAPERAEPRLRGAAFPRWPAEDGSSPPQNRGPWAGGVGQPRPSALRSHACPRSCGERRPPRARRRLSEITAAESRSEGLFSPLIPHQVSLPPLWGGKKRKGEKGKGREEL